MRPRVKKHYFSAWRQKICVSCCWNDELSCRLVSKLRQCFEITEKPVAETTIYRVFLFRNYVNASKWRQSPLLKRRNIVSSCFEKLWQNLVSSLLFRKIVAKSCVKFRQILMSLVSLVAWMTKYRVSCFEITVKYCVSCFEKLRQNLVSNYGKNLCLLCLLLLEWKW